MKPLSSLLLLIGLVCISKLRVTIAQFIGDDGTDAYSSGSGMLDPGDTVSGRGVAYKRIELKFSTKFDFSNSPNSADFLAEVVEQLLRALNNNGGPNPKESNRPAMIDISEIRIDQGSNSRGRRDAAESKERGGNSKLTKFRVFIWVPESTDVNDYLDRISSSAGGNSFLHNIRQIKGSEGDEMRKVVQESDLRRFTAERLPTNVGNIEHGNTRPGHGLLGKSEPTDTGGNTDRENEPVIEVEYEIPTDFFRNPATLAALIAGALAGLLCTILCTIFVVYRMRKKDEGSYALDEPKVSYKYKHEYYIASATKEFFA